jgi:hypothetical protein
LRYELERQLLLLLKSANEREREMKERGGGGEGSSRLAYTNIKGERKEDEKKTKLVETAENPKREDTLPPRWAVVKSHMNVIRHSADTRVHGRRRRRTHGNINTSAVPSRPDLKNRNCRRHQR